MSLLLVYVVLMIIGDIVAYLVGLAIEHAFPQASLASFLVVYFVMLWVAWQIAVRVTRPRASAA
jgi:hypothetical protein